MAEGKSGKTRYKKKNVCSLFVVCLSELKFLWIGRLVDYVREVYCVSQERHDGLVNAEKNEMKCDGH